VSLPGAYRRRARRHLTPVSTPPSTPNDEILRRRQASRRRLRRHRRLLGGIVTAGVIAVVAVASCGSAAPTRTATHKALATEPSKPAIVPGGPLAPARHGGLAALWSAKNVVANQPSSATAYEAASKKPGLPGYLLIADRGNNRILIVNPSKEVVFRYPTPEDLAANRKLVFNDDTFVEPGGGALIANEEDNHAIVQIGIGDHSLTTLFGHPGESGSDHTHLHTPDDAYMLADGTLVVADAYNCRVLFIRAHRIVRQYGTSAVCRHEPPQFLGPVNGDTPTPDGGVLISEVQGSWIDKIGRDGRLKYSFVAPVSYPSDPQPLPGRRILLADYASPGHVLILSRHGKVLWRYGPSGGHGRLDHPSLAMALPNGDIAVNDDYRDRVVVIDPRTKRIVWQYGHSDVPGRGPGFLNTPDGMDFIPAGPNGGPDYAAVVHP
jgi:hypothetical protein